MYVLGFAEGTGYHLYELITRGLSAYRYAPPVVAVFFHLLLLIDPVAGLAVLRRHRAGPMLACLTMAGDLVANWWVNWPAVYAHPWSFVRPYGLLVLTLFGLFVFVTAVPLHRATREATAPTAPTTHSAFPAAAVATSDAPSEG